MYNLTQSKNTEVCYYMKKKIDGGVVVVVVPVFPLDYHTSRIFLEPTYYRLLPFWLTCSNKRPFVTSIEYL
jgi:hypothetical protein